jgi:hypothetical protein
MRLDDGRHLTSAMHPDTGMLRVPPGWNRHVRSTRVRIQDFHQGSSALVRKRGTGPARENGSHPMPVLGQVGAADRVHALVDSEKAIAYAMGDCRLRELERAQLPACDHAVLNPDQLPEPR